MNNTTVQKKRRINAFAWIVTPLILVAIALVGGASVFLAHAASATPSPLSGHYNFRGLTTSGPKNNLYITAQMEMLVTGTTINGHLCGLNVSSIPSHCTGISGTTDGTNVDIVINSVGNFPSIHLVGKFTTNLIHKGATGFAGTYTFGTGATLSSGTWAALNAAVPSIAGSWNFYSIVQQGKDKGSQTHGTLVLMPHENDTYTGVFCMTSSSCIPVKGSDMYGYISLYIGSPVELALRGSSSNGERVASGQFYVTMKGNDDRGYWVMHQSTSNA